MVLALIAPEFIVLFALRQRDTASRLRKGVYTYSSPAPCYAKIRRDLTEFVL
jgi:hypothetical protein